ncbi:hypothetical protein JHD49_09285 [Sulfurimonas sp. SAG-AH-194-C21]|nr:hypothetical protein [Sulfurimonas sp. SAG-AH-194-C21]MDF1884131.1 hypothetical protein [Sulfurimonas sp. SAG-AH-194-C21]
MIHTAENVYKSGKKSLESLLREKAYSDVKNHLERQGIDINDVSDEDIETLVAAKADDMMSGIKGMGIGAAFAFAISMFTGI